MWGTTDAGNQQLNKHALPVEPVEPAAAPAAAAPAPASAPAPAAAPAAAAAAPAASAAAAPVGRGRGSFHSQCGGAEPGEFRGHVGI